MLDQYKTIEKLSALRMKIINKFESEEEELKKLCEILQCINYPWVQFAMESFSEDFSAREILEKKKLLTNAERANIFFQSIVLETAIAVLDATKGFYSGISEYEMLQLFGKNLRDFARNGTWAFSHLEEDPRETRTKKSKSPGDQSARPEPTP